MSRRQQLSNAEIRGHLVSFLAIHGEDRDEEKQKHGFWDDLLRAYGFNARRESTQWDMSSDTFEKTVDIAKKTRMGKGFIDVFAPKLGFLAEHKSRGKSLTKAYEEQGFPYWTALDRTARPPYIICCDFARFTVTEPKSGDVYEFRVEELPDNIDLLKDVFKAGDPEDKSADVGAANIMAGLFETVSEGMDPHDCAMWITRVLFCLYAEDTGIFPERSFTNLIESTPTRALQGTLTDLFRVLDTDDKDLAARDAFYEEFQVFPYVNGNLFREANVQPRLDVAQHEALKRACQYDWFGVNSAIFGAMFQNAMEADHRRAMGEHYTTEESINRLLDPLIFDELEAELTAARSHQDLAGLHDRIAGLQFLDPAAGCGNFLLIAYNRLRQMERRIYEKHRTLARLGRWNPQQIYRVTGAEPQIRIKVSNFHGIEISEYPARIAEVAIYLAQHRWDQVLNTDLGTDFASLPLKNPADMRIANAAELDWTEVVPRGDNVVIVGNPPYNGTRTLGARQKAERDAVWKGVARGGSLDYVAIWFRKAAEFIKGTRSRAALVSTNSICQGEQVAPLWGWMKSQGVGIDFAHQTFAWSNEAKGMAHVHVIIVGLRDTTAIAGEKTLFTYPKITGEPVVLRGPVINSYLVPGADVIAEPRNTPISTCLSEMRQGINFVDGCAGKELGIKNATLIMDESGYREAMLDPIAAKYVRPMLGSSDLINGKQRWCLWLVDATESEIDTSPVLRRRVDNTRRARSLMASANTKSGTKPPHLPLTKPPVMPESNFLLVPRVSSERRKYLPCGLVDQTVITTEQNNAVYRAGMLDFAIASSRHMRLWAGAVAGRLKSDLRYGANSTWNTFAMPEVTADLRAQIESAGQGVLDARIVGATLGEQYDPAKMHSDLREAHRVLDNLMDEAFGLDAGALDEIRLATLFNAYAAATQ